MSTADAVGTKDLDVFRQQARMVDQTLRANVGDVTHEESLVQPQPAGNCLNWVVGHVLCIYNKSLPLFGQEPVMPPDALARYDRGSPPLTDPAEAMPLGTLRDGWDRAVARVDAGLAALTPERLDQPAPFSPSNNPNETVRTLVATVLFHQIYHSGQAGVLRRIAGKPGAIK